VHLALDEKRRLAAAAESESDMPLSPLSPDMPDPFEGPLALNGRASPFGFALALRLGRHSPDSDAMHDHAPAVPITTVELQSFYR
jgi:hypothetical protein